MGPEPVIAIAGSQRAWAAELVRFLSDFGGARFKGTVLTAREALEPGYEVLLIDDIASYLSPRLVERVKDSGQKVIGVYDPESGDRGRQRLRTLGVDAVIRADTGPEEILETISAIGYGHLAGTDGDIRSRPAPEVPLPVTAVAGGDLAGDFAISLGGSFRARNRTTLLVEADTVAPMMAQRLSMPIVPNLLTALDAHIQLRGSIQDSFLAGPYGMTLLTGIPEASEWETVRADEVVDLVETAAVWFDELIVKVSPLMDDLSRLGSRDGRFEVNRSIVGLAGDVVYVAEPTPVGLSRSLRWIAQARGLTAARLHIVFGGTATTLFQRGELSDELTRSYLPSSITWLPSDQGRDRAVWNGTSIPRGPFIKTVERLGTTILKGHSEEPS